MADSVWDAASASAVAVEQARPRHSAMVRVTHWITTVAFLALLLSGIEIVISHPRFYWGETGNVLSRPLFQIPIPSSRDTVPTGYSYVLDDQNGWSRYLHFESAWLLALTGLLYFIFGFARGHFVQNLVPESWSWKSFSRVIAGHLRRDAGDTESYNALQRLTYLGVIFVLFPLIIWTGLAMSPAVDSAMPALVTTLGGRQSARTIHFFLTILLVSFLVIHVAMICLAGFRSRMRAMITGRTKA